MLTEQQVRDLTLPAGWAWSRPPRIEGDTGYGESMIYGMLVMENYTNLTAEDAASRLQAIYAWFEDLDAQGHPAQVEGYETYRFAFPAGFSAPGISGVRMLRMLTAYFNMPTTGISRETEVSGCPCGQTEKPAASLRCDCLRWLICTSCGGATGRRYIYSPETNGFFCPQCIRTCSYREPTHISRCSTPVFGNFAYCEVHGVRETCNACEQQSEQHRMIHMGDDWFCQDCSTRLCPECGEISRHALVASTLTGGNICNTCNRKFAQMSPDETFDETTLEPEKMVIPDAPQRKTRLCSLEIECASPGGGTLALELYNAGLSSHSRRLDYHASGRTAKGKCHVEWDRSLGDDGGELILQKLSMDVPEDAKLLHSALGVVRKQLKKKALNMNMKCGLHVHVDAHKMGLGHIRNLVILFNYLEDPLYRMAAAGYARHRGMRYANKIEKDPRVDRQGFASAWLPNNGHEHALNLGHYWTAMRNNCGCGANLVGTYESCVCNLGKCTIEFRVWNGSASYRKVAAYTAISLSLVSYARMRDDDLNAADFPSLEYMSGQKPTSERKEEWFSRLHWMFENLYFSSNERDNILHVIKDSDLKDLGEERLTALSRVSYRPLEGVPDQAKVKPPETAARRTRSGSTLTDFINTGFVTAPAPPSIPTFEPEWDTIDEEGF